MTKEQFDKYKFSIDTIINFQDGLWDKIIEVDFEKREITVERGYSVKHNEIRHIK
jgi:hypothetical protein